MPYKALLKDSLLYIPAKVLPAITVMFFISFLFRNLSSYDYISYSVIVTTALISTQLSTGWIANSILYYLPQKENKSKFLADALCVMTCAGGIGLIFGSLIIGIQNNYHLVVIFSSLLIVGQILFYTLSSVYQSNRKIEIQLKATVIQCVVQAILLLMLFLNDSKNVQSALLSFGLGFLFSSIYYLIKLKDIYAIEFRAVGEGVRNLKSTNIKEIVRYGAPLGVWTCAMLMINSVDRFFLKNIADGVVAASYLSSKDLLVGASGLITMPLLMASHPRILMKVFENKQEDAEKIIRNNIKILTILFSIYFTLLQFSGLFFLKLMFGNKYLMNIDVLLIVLFGIYFSCISIYAQKGLEVGKKTSLMAIMAGFSAMIAVVLNLILVPRFGILGAAIGFSLSNLFYLLCILINPNKGLRIIIIPVDLVYPVLIWLVGVSINIVLKGMFHESESYWVRGIWLALFMSVIGVTAIMYYRKEKTTA
ncbi:polysaccharide biosynthesis C-terminal domain-containing protein [Collimonas antrihumi]|uniref:oligosaccharide flippase family protein n=1 Tax=Collimonas antrihumi TaxID=1940615 RepID=UPI001B8B47C9|nr:polysaccharide biosynthesis C-terminal domain-containing protein [Collimonas antrihumi]